MFELDKTLDELEQEVLDELNTNYRPYRIINEYTCSLTIVQRDNPQSQNRNERMTANVAEEVAFLRGLSKPLRNDGYYEISKRVNDEISELGKL